MRGAALLEALLSVPVADRDAWIDRALGFEEAPPDGAELPRGCVPYLPSGVDEILALVAEAPLRSGDELVDLGAGLGRVVILAHLLTGARARGIEVQRPLVEAAQARALALGLEDVSFVHADAAETVLDGSTFFLYSPFAGERLARVVRRLEEVARRRPVVVCTVGIELRDVPWLRARASSSAAVTLYDSAIDGAPPRVD
jgi:hypothetical protein